MRAFARMAAAVLWLAVSLANFDAFGNCNILSESTLDFLRQITSQQADLPQLEQLVEINSHLEEDLSSTAILGCQAEVQKCTDPLSRVSVPSGEHKLSNNDWQEAWRRNVEGLAIANCRLDALWVGDENVQQWTVKALGTWRRYYTGMLDSAPLGIAGDKTDNVLWRLQFGELSGVNPKVVVLMVGANDVLEIPEKVLQKGRRNKLRQLGGDIGEKITQIMTFIRHKSCDTTVIAVGLLPIGNVNEEDETEKFMWPSRYTEVTQAVNERVKSFAEQHHRMEFRDCSSVFLDTSLRKASIRQSLLPDGMHLSEEGYARLGSCLHAAFLSAVLQPDPKPDLASTPALSTPQVTKESPPSAPPTPSPPTPSPPPTASPSTPSPRTPSTPTPTAPSPPPPPPPPQLPPPVPESPPPPPPQMPPPVPKSPPPPPEPTIPIKSPPPASWVYTSWSSCSAECGGGIQTRSTFCTFDADGARAPESACPQDSSPYINDWLHHACNTQVCPNYAWVVWPWKATDSKAAESSPSTSTLRRSVRCIDQYGKPANSERECFQQIPRPFTEIETSEGLSVCHLAGTMACNGHGKCQEESCACSAGWNGPSCRSPSDCSSGLVDKSGSCCASGVIDKEGGCCPEGAALDHSGSCCYSGRLDACGICDGNGLHVDIRGQCCPDILDASGTCCSAEMVDECGVCGGDSSTCGLSAEVAIKIVNKFSKWQGILKATSMYLSEKLEPRGISKERISIVGVDIVNTQDLKVMASMPGGAQESGPGMLPDLPNQEQQALHLLVRFIIHSPAKDALPHERTDHNVNHLPVRVLTLAELHEDFEQTGAKSGKPDAKANDRENGGADGLEAFRIGNAAREATCGNGWCEWGEQVRAGHPANASYCPRDCGTSFKACPSAPFAAARQNAGGKEQPRVQKACAGNGLCTGLTGACSCYSGYAGIDCSACAVGYLMDARSGTCVPLAALSDPDATMQVSSSAIHPAEAHQTGPQAAGSSLNMAWIVIGAISGTVALSIAAITAYLALSDCRNHERKPATGVNKADEAGAAPNCQAVSCTSPSLEDGMPSQSSHRVQEGSLPYSAIQQFVGPGSARSGTIDYAAPPPAPVTSHHGSNSSQNVTSISGAVFNLAANMQGRGLANEFGTTTSSSCNDADSSPDSASNGAGQTSCGSKNKPMEANVPVVALHQNAGVICSGVDDPNLIQQQTRPGSSATSSDTSATVDQDGAMNCGAADTSREEDGGTRPDHEAASGASSARVFDRRSIVRNPIGSPYRSRSCSCIDDASLTRASSLPITGRNQDNEIVGGSLSRRQSHSLPSSAVHSLNSAADEAVALPASEAEADEICIRIPDIVHSAMGNADA